MKFMVSSTSSDSHTWNLVYLELLIGEKGHEVVNVGNCVPVDLLVRRCLEERPDTLVVSSVNGHGFRDGVAIAEAIGQRPELSGMTLVIGGKLNTRGSDEAAMERALMEAGYHHVFQGDGAALAFTSLLESADVPVEILTQGQAVYASI